MSGWRVWQMKSRLLICICLEGDLDLDFIHSGAVIDGRYEVIEKVGSGGMGVVYKTREIGLERIVAVKLLHPWLLQDDDSLRRFELEGKILSSLLHANIMRCYRFGVWQARYPYLAVEFLEGKNLKTVLQESGAIEWRRALTLAVQVCDGLAAAHKENVLHRDLKPENIFVTLVSGPEQAKILDFGLAKALSPSFSGGQKNTKTGTLLGSVQYMSPEQCQGQKLDARSDIYSLSCVLFELLTGSAPFYAENAIGFLHLHTHSQRPVLSERIPGAVFPEGLQLVLNRGMAIKSEDRYGTALLLKEDLQLLLAGQSETLSAGLDSAGKKTKGKVLLSLAIVVVLLGVFLASPYAADLDWRAFTMQSPSCSAYLAKIQELIEHKRFSIAARAAIELKSRYGQGAHTASEIQSLIELSDGFKKNGQQAISKQMRSVANSWLDDSLAGIVAQGYLADSADSKTFSMLTTMKLNLINQDATRVIMRRKELAKLILAVDSVPESLCDAELCLRLSKLYLDTTKNTNLQEIPSLEFVRAYGLRLHSLMRLNRQAELAASCEELLGLVASVWGERSGIYVRALRDCAWCSGINATAEKYYLKALDLQNAHIGEMEKLENLTSLSWINCTNGKHQNSLVFLMQALKDCRQETVMVPDYIVTGSKLNEAAPLTQKIGILARIYCELLHLNRKKEAARRFYEAISLLNSMDLSVRNKRFLELHSIFVHLLICASDKDQEAAALRTLDAVISRMDPRTQLDERLKLLRWDYLRTRWICKQLLGRELDDAQRNKTKALFDSLSFSLQSFAFEIADSAEYKNKMSKLSTEEQISYLYENLLSRKVLPGDDTAYWKEVHKKGGISEVTRGFLCSDEFASLLKKQESDLPNVH